MFNSKYITAHPFLEPIKETHEYELDMYYIYAYISLYSICVYFMYVYFIYVYISVYFMYVYWYMYKLVYFSGAGEMYGVHYYYCY